MMLRATAFYQELLILVVTLIFVQSIPVVKLNTEHQESVIENPEESTEFPEASSTELYDDYRDTPDVNVPDLTASVSKSYGHKHHEHDHHGHHDHGHHDHGHHDHGHYPTSVAISGPYDDSHHHVTQFGSPYISYTGPGSYYTGTGYGTGIATGTGYPTAYYGTSTGYNPLHYHHTHGKKSPFANFISLMPTLIAGWMFKTVAVAVSILGVVFFGGAIATTLCTLTPLCSLSFRGINLFKLKESAESVGKIIKHEVTSERIRRAAEFVEMAIEKYAQLQKEVKTK